MTHCIFLPGMMCDERLYAAQINSLPQGVTYSFEPCSSGSSIEQFAIQAMQGARPYTKGPLIVIGLSMGGIIAMECLRQFAPQIDAVVLMDTNHLADPVERRGVRYEQIERALSGELKDVLIHEMKPLYLAPANRDNEPLLGLVLDMALTLGPDIFARQSTALMNRRNYTHTLQQYDKASLILCGVHDSACPPERHHAMHQLMSASLLQLIDDAGHLTTLEAPEVVNKSLQQFIADIQATRCC